MHGPHSRIYDVSSLTLTTSKNRRKEILGFTTKNDYLKRKGSQGVVEHVYGGRAAASDASGLSEASRDHVTARGTSVDNSTGY